MTTTTDPRSSAHDAAPEEVLEARAVVVEHTAGSSDALFGPGATGPLDPVERLALAWVCASAQGSPLADRYAEGAGTAAAAFEVGAFPAGIADLVPYARTLAVSPVSITAADVEAVVAAHCVDVLVVVSQIVAFVSYELRVAVGLSALAGAEPLAVGDPLSAAAPHDEWTLDQLDWTPRAEPLPDDQVGPDAARALELTDANSPYFRLLARVPVVLTERTLTDHAIFRLPGGLPRGERELGALVSSIVNGCVYCASVHARFSSHYSKRSDDVRAVLFDGLRVPLDERWKAIVTAAAALAQPVPQLAPAHIADLRAQGLDDLAISDLVHATAFFAWANRLMLTLGDPAQEA